MMKRTVGAALGMVAALVAVSIASAGPSVLVDADGDFVDDASDNCLGVFNPLFSPTAAVRGLRRPTRLARVRHREQHRQQFAA